MNTIPHSVTFGAKEFNKFWFLSEKAADQFKAIAETGGFKTTEPIQDGINKKWRIIIEGPLNSFNKWKKGLFEKIRSQDQNGRN